MPKTICITGATAGFGKATAELFAKNGWNLILTGRRLNRLQDLQQELSQITSGEVHIAHFDVRNFDETKQALEAIPLLTLSSIDVLVNNAGLASGRASIDQGELEDWNRMIDTNVKGLLHVSKLIIPFLKKNKRGHIINIGSIAGKEVYPNGNVYCATKHAVDALTKSMRIDLLPYQIKVTQIAPGAAETEFSLVRFKGDEDMAKSVYNGYMPLLAMDIAEAIDFVVNRPPHVTINDMVIMPTAQADSVHFNKQ